MTEVEFHTGVADVVGFSCRLLRKAYRRGTRVLVIAPPPTLAALDLALWTFEERDFVPHVRLPGAAAAVARRTPLWLAASAADTAGPDMPTVLVNLGAEPPADPDRLSRLIEVVANDADAAAAGRARWRDYKARGLNVIHHASSPDRG